MNTICFKCPKEEYTQATRNDQMLKWAFFPGWNEFGSHQAVNTCVLFLTKRYKVEGKFPVKYKKFATFG